MSDPRPIGVFDSGIGGLTIARSVARLMPNEEIMFFGDTAHLPYGDKSAPAIRSWLSQITDLLLDRGCKMVLIACNSASAAAYPHLKKRYGPEKHILTVVDPVVELVTEKRDFKRIGVIGTKATISSRIYPKKIQARRPELEVKTLATPLFVPMIEEGYFNNNISQTIVNNYLSNRNLQGIEGLILGCTHYPLIRNEIERYYRSVKEKVEIIDAMEVMALHTQQVLAENGLLAPEGNDPQHHFYVSDFTTSFQKTTHLFFGEAVKLEQMNIWK